MSRKRSGCSAGSAGAIVSVGRMLPTIRSVISIPAGLLSMRLKTFLLWSTLGTAIWTAVLASAGWGLGMAFDDVEKILGPAVDGDHRPHRRRLHLAAGHLAQAASVKSISARPSQIQSLRKLVPGTNYDQARGWALR